MNLVVFPDLQHTERADGNMERYVDQLMAKPPCLHWTEEAAIEVIVLVHDWMLGLIRRADVQRHDAVAVLRGAQPPTVDAEHACLLDTIRKGMMEATCRELRYRGKSLVRRANERFTECMDAPTPKRRRRSRRSNHRVRFRLPGE